MQKTLRIAQVTCHPSQNVEIACFESDQTSCAQQHGATSRFVRLEHPQCLGSCVPELPVQSIRGAPFNTPKLCTGALPMGGRPRSDIRNPHTRVPCSQNGINTARHAVSPSGQSFIQGHSICVQWQCVEFHHFQQCLIYT
jgi:hypothetical protein